MKFKVFATTALVASMSFAPVSPLVAPARADAKDVVAGLIVGGIIGSAIANEKNKKKSSSKKKTKSKSTKSSDPGISTEQKTKNIEVQQALNFFDWPVGTADGAIGPKSKAAIAEYQAFLGYPATGELNDQERLILVTAHARAEAGGAVISDIVSGSAYGMRGVLVAQRDEMAASGSVVAAAPAPGGDGSVAAAAAAAIPKLLPKVEPEPEPEVVAAVAEPAAPPAPAAEAATTEVPALPSFMETGATQPSLAANCDQVNQTTTANGGYATAETMQDASFALAEQFCLVRTAAVAAGDALMAKVAGFSPEEIAQQCAAFGPVLKDHVAALSLRPADEVLAGVEAFILQSGMAPAQLTGTAKVCLSVGYGSDAMDVAIGSALLLTAMGEKGYAEVLGHHLSQGYGATQRTDLAMGWYDIALSAMQDGGDVFLPDMAGRPDLIRKASYTLAGRGGELAPAPKVEEAALPAFAVEPEVAASEQTAPAVSGLQPKQPPAAVAALPEATDVLPAPDTVEDLAAADVPASAATEDVAAEATPVADAPGAEIMQAGAAAAMAAARLPFLFFAGF